jgi:hypothetical protein
MSRVKQMGGGVNKRKEEIKREEGGLLVPDPLRTSRGREGEPG